MLFRSKELEGDLLNQYETISNETFGIPKPVIEEPPPKEPPPKTQGQRLKDLDTERDAMIELAKSTGQDISAVEKEYYNERLNLLYSFLDEDVKANKFTWATIGEDLDTPSCFFVFCFAYNLFFWSGLVHSMISLVILLSRLWRHLIIT